MRKIASIILLLLFDFQFAQADDLCYGEPQYSGSFCFSTGICSLGLGCKTTIPIISQTDKTLSNVQIYYNENDLSGSFGDQCEVSPDGNCSTTHNVDLGNFGFFNQATEFNFSDPFPPQASDRTIAVENFARLSCFDREKLYATYVKDGETKTIQLQPCQQSSNDSCGLRPFEVINPESTQTINGDYAITGNTVECVTNYQYSFDGTCTNDLDKNDNNYMVKYIDIDGNSSTWNSSSAYLTIPDMKNKEIIWAGIFWQGNVNNYVSWWSYTNQRRAIKSGNSWNYEYINYASKISPSQTDANQILFKIDGITDYIPIAAQKFDCYRWYGDYGFIYSAFSDITGIFQYYQNTITTKNQLTLTVANLTTNEGRESTLGDFGAWSVVVIYKDKPTSATRSPLKRVLIYNGFQIVEANQYNKINIDITNLYLPQKGEVKSQFASFAGEGEYAYSPDHMLLESQTMPGAARPNNIFDATLANINRPDIGNNAVINANGIDIDLYDVSTIMTKVRDNNPNTTSVTLSLDTSWDAYFPSLIAFSVQLYEPNVCYIEEIFKGNSQIAPQNPNNTPVYIGDRLTTKLTITNTDNEIAQDVIVYKVFDNNITEYVSNSTKMQNVGESQISPKTDTTNDDEIDFFENNLTMRIGRGADASQGGTLYTNDTVQIQFDSILQTDQQFSYNYQTSYTFTIAGQTFHVNSSLPKCTEFNNTIIVSLLPSGLFDAWDTFRDLNDRNISTKIVNQPFELIIASLNPSNNALQTTDTNIRYALADENNNSVTQWKELNFSTTAEQRVSFNISKAYKQLHAAFEFCAQYDGNSFYLYKLNECSNRCELFEQTQVPCLKIATSSDAFAIRPYTFKIFGNNEYLRAGEEFNLTLKAVDENNDTIHSGTLDSVEGVKGYNASLNSLQFQANFYQPTPDQIAQMQQDIGDQNTTINGEVAKCPHNGNFQVSGPNFIDGETNATLTYSETGILMLSVREVNGSEWAIVDVDDTNDSTRFIKETTKIMDISDISKTDLLLFVPYRFETSTSYKTTTNRPWVYMADINSSHQTFSTPQMAAYVKYSIVAKNKNGVITKNYTKTCFPDVDEVHAPRQNGLKLNTTFDLFLDAKIDIPRDLNITLYTEDNQSNAIWTLNKNMQLHTGRNAIQEWISPFQFENGRGEAIVYFNIDRQVDRTLQPLLITISETNVSTSWMSNPGSPKEFVSLTPQEVNNSFYYARIHAPDHTVKGDDMLVRLYIELYDPNQTDPAGIEGNVSVDDIGWYQNPHHDFSSMGSVVDLHHSSDITHTLQIGSDGIYTASLRYNGTTFPATRWIDINASSWLIYNRYDPNATTNSFKATFLGSGSWVGPGKNPSDQNLNPASPITPNRINW